MTSRLENYAQWLVDNESKRGTPEFDTVARAYKALRGQPQEVQVPQPPQERTWGEAAKDVGASLVSGVGSLVQLPGQLYGLATGDFAKTGALGLGEDISKYGEEMKSAGLKAREAARAVKVQEAEKLGNWEAFKAALGETITDPALLSSFLAEQAPQLLPMILTGGTAAAITAGRATAAQLAKGATKEAAAEAAKIAATRAGTTAAIQTGAVMQGADVGAGAYDEIFNELVAKGASPEQAAAETINKARLAGVAGYALSVLANRYLPGGKALEEVLAGKRLAGSRLGTAAITGLKEIPGENIEEVGGRIAQNIAAQQAGLERDILSGTGETAAMATIGAAGMGGGAGLLAGRARTPEVAPPAPAIEEKPEEAAAPPAAPTPTTKTADDLFKELILGEGAPEPTKTEPTTVDELRAAYEAGVTREAELRNKPKGEKTPEETIELQQIHQRNRALKKKLDDAIAQAATQGATDVAGTEQPAGGAGAPVPAQPAAELPAAEGAVAPERAGMVPAGPDVAVTPEGKAGKPVAVTWDTLKPGQTVMLYRGEGQEQIPDGQWWTTDKGKAEKYGKVTEVSLPAETVGRNAARGQTADEFVFASVSPTKLAQTTGEPLGTQAPQAVQAETQGQEAPAAPVIEEPAVEPRQELLTKRKAQAEALGIDLRDIQQDEIDAQLAETEKRIGEKFDEERKDVVYDEEAQNFIEEAEKGKLSPQFGWEGEKLGAFADMLDRNGVDSEAILGRDVDVVPEDARTAKLQEALGALQGKREQLRSWDRLTEDQKRVYLDNLTTNELGQITPLARQRALEALNRYTTTKTRTPSGEVRADRVEGLYETQRTAYEQKYGIVLRPYSELSQEDKARLKADLKFRKVNNRPADPTTENIDQAFRNLVDAIKQRGEARAVEMRAARQERAQREKEELQASEFRAYEKAQKGAQEEREQRGKTRIETAATAAAKEKQVPKPIVEAVKNGDMGAVLNWLVNSIPNPNRTIGVNFQRLLARKIKALKLNTKIQFVESLPDGDIAQYDPKTDTISVTMEGMKPSIILHELVHAATVKVLDRVERNDTANLTDNQIDAANQLDELMAATERQLAETYPEAYRNIFEFVSYAMTNRDFQKELKRLPADLIKNTVLRERNALSKFMDLVIKTLRLESLFGPQGGVFSTNLLAEVVASFEQIVAVPRESIERAPLPAKAGAVRVQAPELPDSVKKTVARSPLPSAPKLDTILGTLTTYRGLGNILKYAVNERIMLKRWQDGLTKAGKITFGTNKSNAVYAAVLRSTGIAADLFKENGQKLMEDVQKGVIDYAKTVGVDGAEALRRIGTVMVALHEPERRQTLFKIYVPLQNMKVDVKYPDGKTRNVNPAQVRKDIFRVLDQNQKIDPTNMKYLQELLDTLTKNHVDPNGFSGLDSTQSEKRFAKKTDINDGVYNVAGQSSQAELKEVLSTLYSPDRAGYKELNDVVEALKKAQKASERMNKMANYWTQPVDNRVEFYGWQNYTPLRGKLGFGTGEQNDRVESQVEPTQLSTRMAQYEKGFFGRESDPDNTVLLVMSDMAKAAMRNGIREISAATVNAINAGLMPGKTNQTIKFEDRHNFEPDFEQKTIFHYEPNGDIRIVKIDDAPLAEAIKGTFKRSNPLIDIPATMTSFMGKTHTRYNLAFAPVDFVRNVLTNAALMGADMSPAASAKYIANIAGAVATGGLKKAWVAGSLYESGNLNELKRLAGGSLPYDKLNSTQRFYRDTLDYIQGGGKISYLKGISSKTLQEEVEGQMTKYGFLKEPKVVENFLNRYSDMFELATRVEAFRISRADKLAELMKEKAPKTEAEKAELLEDSAAYAIYYTKDLANFEQTGKWGNALAAWFMFWRPAATGAYRAIESLAPLFQDADYAMKLQLPRTIWDPDSKKYDPQAIKKFKERHAEQKKAALLMTGLLATMGATVYSMAAALSDDDDMARNKALTDDPAQWTRYARFHIPGFDNPIRIPWGFGPGAFAAAGAQLAMVSQGAATWSDALVNIWHVATDSYLPLPFSKVDPTEKPAVWLIDSLTPAPLRPLVQFTLNTDGLGRRIYNDTQSRYSNVFVAGFNIPEIYKTVAEVAYEATGGAIEVQPNSLYFFATNYADGILRPLTTLSNLAMVSYGSKEFTAKTDLPILSGFIGAASNVDSREFAKAETKVLALRQRLATLEQNFPEKYEKFIADNPMAEAIVEEYNKNVNGELKKLRSELKEVSRMRDLTPKERNDIRKQIVLMQNLEKRMMLDTFEAYGL